jgi:hypothetical protein
MQVSLKKFFFTIAVSATLIACGKSVSVKDDWNQYQVESVKAQKEMQTKQATLMQSLAKAQETPEAMDAFTKEVDTFLADGKTKLNTLKPQTEPVKKFHAQQLKSIDDMGTILKDMSQAIKAKDAAALQTTQKKMQGIMMDLQKAQMEVIEQAGK